MRIARLTFAISLLVATHAAPASDPLKSGLETYFGSEVVEGASKHLEAPEESPATVTVITRAEIERYGFKTVGEVINFASLGYFIHDDRKDDFVGGRGLFFFEDFNTRILVLLNGHPLNEPWNGFGGVGRAMLPSIATVERVEIVYGPSSILYGGYALNGMINVVTAKGATLPGKRLNLSGGSLGIVDAGFVWGSSGFAESEGGGREWDILASVSYYESDGENLDLPLIEVDYPVDGEGNTTWGGPQRGNDRARAPDVFFRGEWGDFTLMARSGARTKLSPLAPYESIYGCDCLIRDEKDLVELRWDRKLSGALDLSVRLFHDWYGYEEVDSYATEDPDLPVAEFNLLADAVDRGVEARLNSQLGEHFLTAGAEFRVRDIDQHIFETTPDGALIEDTTQIDAFDGRLSVVYLQDEWRPRDDWTFIVGGTLADTDPGGSKVIPRVAAIYRTDSALALKAIYVRGFRPPSIYESDYADFAGQINNPTLRSEDIATTELSILWRPQREVQVTAYAFHSELRDLIRDVLIESPDEVEGGVEPPSGDPDDLSGNLQYQSVGDVRSFGAGVALQYRGDSLNSYVNVAWSESELRPTDDEPEDLPANPEWVASAGVSWRFGPWTASLTARMLGSQRLDPARETRGSTDPFFEANTRLLWKTTFVVPIDLYFDVRNLFDEEGLQPASSIYAPDTFPMLGRRWMLGATIVF